MPVQLSIYNYQFTIINFSPYGRSPEGRKIKNYFFIFLSRKLYMLSRSSARPCGWVKLGIVALNAHSMGAWNGDFLSSYPAEPSSAIASANALQNSGSGFSSRGGAGTGNGFYHHPIALIQTRKYFSIRVIA